MTTSINYTLDVGFHSDSMYKSFGEVTDRLLGTFGDPCGFDTWEQTSWNTWLRFGTKLSSQGRVIQVVLCDCFGSCQHLGLATRAIFRGLFGACAVYRSRLVNAFANQQTRQWCVKAMIHFLSEDNITLEKMGRDANPIFNAETMALLC